MNNENKNLSRNRRSRRIQRKIQMGDKMKLLLKKIKHKSRKTKTLIKLKN